jgi:hypothetical protein
MEECYLSQTNRPIVLRPISSVDRATDFESVSREFESLMGHVTLMSKGVPVAET